MNNKELNKLEALAKAAGTGNTPIAAMVTTRDFQAAANPAAILELIALVRRSLPVDNDLYTVAKNICDRWDAHVPTEEVTDEHKALRAALARAGSAAPAAPTQRNIAQAIADYLHKHTNLSGESASKAGSDLQALFLAAPTAAEGPSLHNAIMNIRCEPKQRDNMNDRELIAYKIGHRDARHAAAELANERAPTKEGEGEVDAKDAARWQWLREKHDGGDEDWFVYGASSQHLDASIDAAIAAQPKDTTDTQKGAQDND